MKSLFRYNWQVRGEWFEWCEQLPEEALLKERAGGVGGILKTLFHIADVEYSWIMLLQDKPEFDGRFEDYASLEQVKELSGAFHTEVKSFLMNWEPEMGGKILTVSGRNGELEQFTYEEVLLHTIAHEIHHAGQLSVWSRELGLEPVNANLINRGLYSKSITKI
ncbi:MAG: DinB family protein [Tuberibacillus sp.]